MFFFLQKEIKKEIKFKVNAVKKKVSLNGSVLWAI